MYQNKQAFTLIELLVVVLIIGILAAVAVPQYQKAVRKAQFTEVTIKMDTLMKAMDVYLLENGFPGTTKSYLTNPPTLSLDIDVPLQVSKGTFSSINCRASQCIIDYQVVGGTLLYFVKTSTKDWTWDYMDSGRDKEWRRLACEYYTKQDRVIVGSYPASQCNSL